MHSYLQIATPAAPLQRSIPLLRRRLQRSSRSLNLHASAALHLQCAFRPRRYTDIEPADIHTSMSPRHYTCSAPPDLQTFRPLYSIALLDSRVRVTLHIATPAACRQSCMSPRLHERTSNASPGLQRPMPPYSSRRHTYERAPSL